MNDDISNQNTNHYVNDYQPPEAPATTAAADFSGAFVQDAQDTQNGGQSLEDQNIFTLLGAEDGTEEQKEEFLDELQQVIWEDFIENDTSLLLTEEEMSQLKQILDKTDIEDLEKQEESVVFLEKLIPDLEQIMLEKALELKEDMVRERAAGLREFFSGDTDKQAIVTKAEQLMDQGLWSDAAVALNSI